MLLEELSAILVEQHALASQYLNRLVIVDIYRPKHFNPSSLSLLVLNDGQNLDEMPFAPLLNGLVSSGQISPLLCVGIHCNKDRIEEYGTASLPDYEGRGRKAKAYQEFVVEELLPFLQARAGIDSFLQYSIAGFSMADVLLHFCCSVVVRLVFGPPATGQAPATIKTTEVIYPRCVHRAFPAHR